MPMSAGHDTSRAAWVGGYALALLLTLGFRFWMGAVTPFTGDEAYFYWWGKQPDWGFYDHPPMVGWWLAALISISESEYWLRLPVILQPAILSALMLATLRERPDWQRYGAALLVLLAPANLWNVFITTDTPLVYFGFGSALAFLHAMHTRRMAWFGLAGVLLGGAFLSKYFAVLLGLAYIVAVATVPRPRPWSGLAVLVACALPAGMLNAWWNSEHCWSNILFNVFNRHGDAAWSWKTPLLYLGMMAYLLTPVVALALWRGRRALRERAGVLCLLGWVPLGFFLLLSARKVVGMHWVLTFIPLVLMAYALTATHEQMRRALRFFTGFALLHLAVILFIATRPLEFWADLPRTGLRQASVVMTVKPQDLLEHLRPFRDYVPMTNGYSPSVTMGYNDRRYWGVFGPASSHARHDDIMTDFSALDGRSIMILTKSEPERSEYEPYFHDIEIVVFELHGARFWRVMGRGFRYAAYREGVLEPVRKRWYRIPDWLPQRGCYFFERYFPGL